MQDVEHMIKALFAKRPDKKPLVITQRAWANGHLDISSGANVLLVAATNEVLRHCRIGKVSFKDQAQNHS